MRKYLHIGIAVIIILVIVSGYWFLFSPTAKAKKDCIDKVEYHPPTDSVWTAGDYYAFNRNVNAKKFKTYEEAFKVCIQVFKEYY